MATNIFRNMFGNVVAWTVGGQIDTSGFSRWLRDNGYIRADRPDVNMGEVVSNPNLTTLAKVWAEAGSPSQGKPASDPVVDALAKLKSDFRSNVGMQEGETAANFAKRRIDTVERPASEAFLGDLQNILEQQAAKDVTEYTETAARQGGASETPLAMGAIQALGAQAGQRARGNIQSQRTGENVRLTGEQSRREQAVTNALNALSETEFNTALNQWTRAEDERIARESAAEQARIAEKNKPGPLSSLLKIGGLIAAPFTGGLSLPIGMAAGDIVGGGTPAPSTYDTLYDIFRKKQGRTGTPRTPRHIIEPFDDRDTFS